MVYKILFILLSLIFSLNSFSQIECTGSFRELKGVMGQNFESAKQANDCLLKLIQHYQSTGLATIRDTGKVLVLIPKDKNQKAEVIKYNSASKNEKDKWGQDKILIHSESFKRDGWKFITGKASLRNGVQDKDKLDENDIDWSRDRNSIIVSCVKKSCGQGERYNSFTCACEKKDCSPSKVAKEKQECSEYISQNSKGKKYEIEFLAKYDESSCQCIKDKNPSFIPPKKRACAQGTEEYLAKAKACSDRTDNEASFTLNDDCKCEKTKKFCDGRFATRLEYDKAKESCESQANHKWVDCECRDPNGQKLCSYKEKRKNSEEKRKMSFNRDEGSEQHWANEPDYRQGPCDIKNWLSKIGSTKKDVNHCDEYEKLVIKKNGLGDDDFKEKRFFCTKCKEGYSPNTTSTSIEGVNDVWMEQPAYTYVTSCEKIKSPPCSAPRFERRKQECREKNNEPKNKERGISYSWDDETCKCDKDRDPTWDDEIPKECANKISKSELKRCESRGGDIVFSDNGCHCDAPCYETIVDNDQVQVGSECVPDGSKPTGFMAQFIENAEDLSKKECDGVTSGSNLEEKKRELLEQCQQQASSKPGQHGVRSESIELSVKMTSTVTCPPISIKQESGGFADKIPGLVGGLDLVKDFESDGKKISSADDIDCSKNKLTYKPQGHNNSAGSYNTKQMGQQQCENLKAMYNKVSQDAQKYVDAIVKIPNLTNAQKVEKLKQHFKADVFATANRSPHGSGKVDHQTLSQKRADSMRDFYTSKVVEAIQANGLNISVDDLKSNSSSSTIAYFGPPPKSGYENDNDPNYKICKLLKDAKKRYECMVDLHIEYELDQLKKNDEQKQGHLSENFAKAVMDHKQFKDYFGGQVPKDFDLYGKEGMEKYKEFLYKQYDKEAGVMDDFLDTMKIFDLNANSQMSIDNTKTIESDLKLTCTINYEDLYRDSPIFTSHEVRYGKRPGLVDSFSKECREDYEQLLDKIVDDYKKKNPDAYEARKRELKEDFPENWEKKFNREMRKMARKEWRKAKYNTRQVTKAVDGQGRWKGGSDEENNRSEIYDEMIQPGVENKTWENNQYKNKPTGN